MPHQCVRCGAMYQDGAKEILSGCKCSGKLFFFIKKERMEEATESAKNLSHKEKLQLEKDVLDIIGDNTVDQKQTDKTIILDFESIRALKPGVFELDLVTLFNNKNPLVYKLAEGKYMIDVAESFARKTREEDEE